MNCLQCKKSLQLIDNYLTINATYSDPLNASKEYLPLPENMVVCNAGCFNDFMQAPPGTPAP